MVAVGCIGTLVDCQLWGLRKQIDALQISLHRLEDIVAILENYDLEEANIKHIENE